MRFIISVISLSLFSCFGIFAQDTDAASVIKTVALATGIKNYGIDSVHSKVSFEVAHLVVSTVTGQFDKFEGTFKFDPNDFIKTELNATADAISIDTGVKKRDDHLRSPDFFDTKNFPSLKFKSTAATKTGDKTFDLMGNMTIRGVTKPVIFHVIYKGQVPEGKKLRQVFKATTTINRMDFGVKFQNIVEIGPVVGEEVTINISVEGVEAV